MSKHEKETIKGGQYGEYRPNEPGVNPTLNFNQNCL
jgi:hypothetical protein